MYIAVSYTHLDVYKRQVGGMGSVSLSNIINISLIYFGIIVASIMVFFNQGGWDAAMQMASTSACLLYTSKHQLVHKKT